MGLADRALLTRRGRMTLFVLYAIAAVASIVVYGVFRSLGYAIGQFVVLGFGAGWVYWCLHRPRP